jgi:hypothetical protein
VMKVHRQETDQSRVADVGTKVMDLFNSERVDYATGLAVLATLLENAAALLVEDLAPESPELATLNQMQILQMLEQMKERVLEMGKVATVA